MCFIASILHILLMIILPCSVEEIFRYSTFNLYFQLCFTCDLFMLETKPIYYNTCTSHLIFLHMVCISFGSHSHSQITLLTLNFAWSNHRTININSLLCSQLPPTLQVVCLSGKSVSLYLHNTVQVPVPSVLQLLSTMHFCIITVITAMNQVILHVICHR